MVIKLDVPFDMITTANLESLRVYVCQVTGRSPQDYIINTIATGSTVVSGSLGVSTADSTTIVDSLAVAFTQGSSIGGISVIGSTFDAVNTDATTPTITTTTTS